MKDDPKYEPQPPISMRDRVRGYTGLVPRRVIRDARPTPPTKPGRVGGSKAAKILRGQQ